MGPGRPPAVGAHRPTNDEVRADRDRIWRSDLPADQAEIHLGAAPGEMEEQLAALAELGKSGTWRVFGRDLKVTNLDKELFPGRDGEPPVTKRELLRYTARVAPVAVPYLAGRALNMRRHLDGARTKGSGTSNDPTTRRPTWVPGTTTRRTRGRPPPTRSCTSADPPRALVRRDPCLGRAAVADRRRGRPRAGELEVGGSRKGKARLDYTENAINKTLVAPYSPHAAPGAPVSMPITWEELDDPELRPDRWTIRTSLERVEERGDLFRGVLTERQKLPLLA